MKPYFELLKTTFLYAASTGLTRVLTNQYANHQPTSSEYSSRFNVSPTPYLWLASHHMSKELQHTREESYTNSCRNYKK